MSDDRGTAGHGLDHHQPKWFGQSMGNNRASAFPRKSFFRVADFTNELDQGLFKRGRILASKYS